MKCNHKKRCQSHKADWHRLWQGSHLHTPESEASLNFAAQVPASQSPPYQAVSFFVDSRLLGMSKKRDRQRVKLLERSDKLQSKFFKIGKMS